MNFQLRVAKTLSGIPELKSVLFFAQEDCYMAEELIFCSSEQHLNGTNLFLGLMFDCHGKSTLPNA